MPTLVDGIIPIQLHKRETTLSLRLGVHDYYFNELSVPSHHHPVRWEVRGVSPHGWLSDNTTQKLSREFRFGGSVAEEGLFDFAIVAIDHSGNSHAVPFRVVILPPETLSIAPVETVRAEVGDKVRIALTVRNNKGPVGWGISEGRLPEGLAFDVERGMLYGTLLSPGEYHALIMAYDAKSKTTQSLAFIVSGTNLVPDPIEVIQVLANLPRGTINPFAHYHVIRALALAQIPHGIAHQSLLAEVLGLHESKVMRQIRSGEIFVLQNDQWLRQESNARISHPHNGQFIVSEPVMIALKAHGLSPHTTWSVADGSLPLGLKLHPVSGTLEGVPVKPGIYNATIKVSDSEGFFATMPFTAVVKEPDPSGARSNGSISGMHDEVELVFDKQAVLVGELVYCQITSHVASLDGMYADVTIESPEGSQTLLNWQRGPVAPHVFNTVGSYVITSIRLHKRISDHEGIWLPISARIIVQEKHVLLPEQGDSVTVPISQKSERQTHIVKSKETLWSIAKKYYGEGKLWRILMAANAQTLKHPQNLKPGMTLVIPTRNH